MSFYVKDGVLKRYSGSDETVDIPDGVTKIGPVAFKGCVPLTTVNIPDSVKVIGFSAFKGCESLGSIQIPQSVEMIGTWAFAYCTSLKEVTILGRTKSIGYNAFEDCDNMMYIVAHEIQIDVIKEAKLMQAATMGFLRNSELYTNEETVAEYKKYASSQKKHLVPLLTKDDNVKAISWYAENGIITKKNFETDFLNPAMSANATNCVAYLLNWKNENLSGSGAGDFKL